MNGLWGGTTAGALRVQLAAVQRKRSSRRVFGSVRPTARMHSAHEENLRPLRIFAEYTRAQRAKKNFAVRYGALQIFAPPLRPVSTYSASVTNICFARDL